MMEEASTWFNIDVNVLSYFFINESVGFIISGSGLNKTVDGGATYNFLSNIGGCLQQKLFAPSDDVVWGIPVECPLNGDPCYSIKDETSGVSQIQYNTDFLHNFFRARYFTSVTNGYAVGSYGSIQKNSTGLLLDIYQFQNKGLVKIYPNPSSEQITISFNEKPAQPYSVEITDSLGKKVFSKTYNDEDNITINTKSFSKGIYFLSVLSKQINETQTNN